MSMDWKAAPPWDFEFVGVNGRLAFEWSTSEEDVRAWIQHCLDNPDATAAYGYGRPTPGSYFVERYIRDGRMSHPTIGDLAGALRSGDTSTPLLRQPRVDLVVSELLAEARRVWGAPELAAYEDEGQWWVDVPGTHFPRARAGGSSQAVALQRVIELHPKPTQNKGNHPPDAPPRRR